MNMEKYGSMDWVEPSGLTQVVFLSLVTFVLLAFVVGVYCAYQRSARAATFACVGGLLLVCVTGAYVLSGLPAMGGPALGALFGFANLSAIGLAFSRVGTRLKALPLSSLLVFQAFRAPLEWVLHAWYQEGVIPQQMTFAGHNFDIISGLLACGILLYIVTLRRQPPKALLIFVNMVGSLLLVAVIVIAALSSPLPFRVYEGQALLLGTRMPYALIATVCVAGAASGHLIAWRAILGGSVSTTSDAGAAT